LRVRTWIRIDNVKDAAVLVEDSAALAELEGLDGHARAAYNRRSLK
jgi:hypothetical protein